MESSVKSPTKNTLAAETESLSVLKYLNDSVVECVESGPRLGEHKKQSFKKTGSEGFSDGGRVLTNSDGKIHRIKLNVPDIMRHPERMIPVVVLPDLKLLMQRQSKGAQIRVPFGKVNPLTLRETLPEDFGRRRNATRACKKPEFRTESVSLKGEGEIQQPLLPPPPQPVIDLCVTSRKRRTNVKVPRKCDRSLCKYCGKSFAFEDFAKEHEVYCEGGPGPLPVGPRGDISGMDDGERKSNFLNLFGLREMGSMGSTKFAAETSGSLSHPEQKFDELDEDVSVSPESEQLNPKRLRSKKMQLSSFLRNNPIPFSSDLGRKLVLESKVGVCHNSEEMTRKYDQFCVPSTSRLYVKESKQNWPTTISRKMRFKKYQYVHQCTFSKTQRLARNEEIVLGLNSRASSLFNSCQDVSIIANKMREEETDKYMLKKHIRNLISLQSHQKTKRKRLNMPMCSSKFLRVEVVGLESTAEGREILRRSNIIPRH